MLSFLIHPNKNKFLYFVKEILSYMNTSVNRGIFSHHVISPHALLSCTQDTIISKTPLWISFFHCFFLYKKKKRIFPSFFLYKEKKTTNLSTQCHAIPAIKMVFKWSYTFNFCCRLSISLSFLSFSSLSLPFLLPSVFCNYSSNKKVTITQYN